MSEICDSGRIVVDSDTIFIRFMRARLMLTIEMKCPYLLQPFQRSFTVIMRDVYTLILFCKLTMHTVVLLWVMQ